MAVTNEVHTKPLIGGEWVDGHGGTMESRSAWSGQLVAELDRCSDVDVDLAVEAATSAQPAWAGLCSWSALTYCDAFTVIIDHGEELAQMITLETGKTINETREEILDITAPAYHKAAEEALRHRGMTLPSTQELSDNKRLLLTHRPVGVIGVITPYKFPTDIGSIAIAHAIAVGNTVGVEAIRVDRRQLQHARIVVRRGGRSSGCR